MANEVETFLSEKGIPFERYEFPWRLEEETARLKAEELTIPEEIIFKTLVVKGNKSGATIALVPLTAHLDYKKLAKPPATAKSVFHRWSMYWKLLVIPMAPIHPSESFCTIRNIRLCLTNVSDSLKKFWYPVEKLVIV